MEYGLRRYEATQRLLWFIFFFGCLVLAYLISAGSTGHNSDPMALLSSFRPQSLKTASFWTELRWIGLEPLGGVIFYFIWVAILFLMGRSAWLLTQYVGKYMAKDILATTVKGSVARPRPGLSIMSDHPERLFPTDILLHQTSRFPYPLIFHSFQRLRLMLSNSQRILSSEELVDKERRIVETDWSILSGSWIPFRWLLWLLPLLGLIQTSWLFSLYLQPTLSGLKEFQDVLGPLLTSLLPLVQMIGIVIVFSLARGFLRRLENLYLSDVDALFYDQFVSRIPFQSSDTLILLEALRKHFQELHAVLRRMEQSSVNEQDMTSTKS